MSDTTFGTIDKEVAAETVAPSDSKEVTTKEAPTSTEVSTYTSDAPEPEDINIDFLQVLGKSSQFDVDGASIGDIIYNKTTPLASLDESLSCIVVSTRKYWKENVPYEDDTVPRFAYTQEEKAQIESSTDFDGTVPVSEIILLVERPASFTDDEAAAGIFLYEFGGYEYALVKYTVQKAQAVRENYGTVSTRVRAQATKGEDARDYYFELRSKEKGQGMRFKWHQFVLNGTREKAPEEAVAFAASLRGE